MKINLFLLGLFLIAGCNQTLAQTQVPLVGEDETAITCKVETIVSSNTFTCKPEGKPTMTLTINGYDVVQAHANVARNTLADRIDGKNLAMPTYGTDEQGRLRVDVVWLQGGICIGEDPVTTCATALINVNIGEVMRRSGLLRPLQP